MTSDSEDAPRCQSTMPMGTRGHSEDGKAVMPVAPALRRLHLHLATRTARHLDACLIVLLLGNLSLLFLSTMPRTYFFGFKVTFVKWISRSLLYKAYARSTPLVLIGATFLACLTAAAGRAVRGAKARWPSLLLANGIMLYVQSRLYELIRGDARPVLKLEERAEEREMLNWEPPSPRLFTALTYFNRALMPGRLFGQDNLPQGRRERILFVGNHAVWGLDVPVLLHALYDQTGIFPRALGSHAWFALPLLREVTNTLAGAIDGTERNCDLLMHRGHNLLVYPGGEREAWKKLSDTKYSLIWGESMGFARMAIKHGYTIIPVASVGAEDMFEVVADFPLSKVLRLGGLIPPATSKKTAGNAFMEGSTLPVLMPRVGRLQKIYFKLGRPIQARPPTPTHFDPAFEVEGGLEDVDGQERKPLAEIGVAAPSHEEARALRDEVREALTQEVNWLLNYRESDPDRYMPAAQALQAVRKGLTRPKGSARSRL